jgi:hypothetical protein
MTKPTDPYSRVYWRIIDDERFANVYGDDHHLAAWLRLLLIADQAWPASANLPASVRSSSIRALTDCGLIELRAGGVYRVHGLDAERGKRQAQAVIAADARWMQAHPVGNADGMLTGPNGIPSGMPRRAETSIDETSIDEQDPPWLTAWLQVRMRMPTQRQRDVLDAYLRAFDVSGPERASRVILSHPDDPLGAIIADLRSFREEAKAGAEVQEREAIARRKVERRGFRKGSVEYELAQMLAAKQEGLPG